ncbi:glycoside hydrolase family 88 protein [Pseudoflavitalea sp. X16]|uniref:glycoside hydrolase family 88/105 protein n=1 Tax=Paraflavitalea devenefica TaxID=2716334 RepID=UPI0014230B9A|nr:glycoside hydrolase family 88 protein [Paraflavitalea devenefica]NII27298.1 glycoside hydrolase family 88 protein [Paraflavitalea devenefica]
MKQRLTIALSLTIITAVGFAGTAAAQTSVKLSTVPVTKKWSQEMATTAMKIWSDSFALTPDRPARWSYDQGVILKGIEGIWNAAANVRYFDYIQRSMDFFVQEDGTIKGYRPDEYNIDHINNGKLILLLYRVTGKEKYKKAADLLRSQLRHHPRTSEGGFWHKNVYPFQMWLDGLYMGQPYYAEYAKIFHEDTAFHDITRQFVLMERHARDSKTGLLYHGWDETRQQKWANKTTGLSPHFWGRALGWYGMAMVDALDHFPARHPGRDSIIAILNRYAKAVVKVQDPKSGAWYDIVDMPNEKGNYLEASASAMIVYTLAKGMRHGYLPATYLPAVQKGYAGILKTFIETDANGQTNLKGTVKVSGLGGNPYRDGSFAYYMSEPVIVNDPKGVGAFIKCAVEVEMLPTLPLGNGKTVLLDNWFNNEWKKDATGEQVRHHYTWDDKTYGGFAMLGDIFRIQGMRTASLETAPTAQNLKGASIYIIVDPDTKKETPDPHFIQPQDVKAISDWVKAGGVLFLMGNDSGNAEFEHWNHLGEAFGIHFNENSLNRVQGNQYEQGAFYPTAQDAIFKTSKKIYIKEYSSLQLQSPATAVFKDAAGKNIVMAVSKYGKGTVFAVGDPWFYNEYVDGRKLPADFENYKAATDLVKWLIGKTNKK